jgi:hypothetical protein
VEVHKIDEIYWQHYCQQQRKNPAFAWDLNMNSLFHVLLKPKKIKKIFWPSSIAFFGPTTPKKIRLNTPSWSRPRYTESASNLVKDGVNTTIISLV